MIKILKMIKSGRRGMEKIPSLLLKEERSRMFQKKVKNRSWGGSNKASRHAGEANP